MGIRGALRVPNFMRYVQLFISRGNSHLKNRLYKAEIGPIQTLIWHQNLSKVCLTTSYQIPVIGSLRLCSRYPNQNVMEFVKSSALTHYVKFIRVVRFCLFWKQSILTNFCHSYLIGWLLDIHFFHHQPMTLISTMSIFTNVSLIPRIHYSLASVDPSFDPMQSWHLILSTSYPWSPTSLRLISCA